MKYCSKCGTHKPLESFVANRAQPDSLNNYCKSCQRSKDKVRRKDILQWFREYKSTLSCEKCGQNHPATLDFHHNDPSEKDNNVYFFVKNGYSQTRIMTEIDKCSVLCANCHRILHYDERTNDDC